MRSHLGLRHEDLAKDWRLDIGEGIGGKVISTGVPALVYDYAAHPNRVVDPVGQAGARRRVHVTESLRCSMLVPLGTDGGGIFGLMVFASRESGAFGSEDLASAREVCAVSSAAIGSRLAQEAGQRDAARRRSPAERLLAAVVDRVVAHDDISGGVDLLGSFLGCGVRLVDSSGEVVAQHGDVTLSDTLGLAVPDGERAPGILGFSEDVVSDGLSPELMENVVAVFGAALARERRTLESDIGERSRLFERLLSAPVGHRERIQCTALLGLDPRGSVQVTAVGPPTDDPRHADLIRLTDRVVRMGTVTTAKPLVVLHGDTVVVVATESDTDLSMFEGMLSRRWPELNFGRSGVVDVSELPQAVDDAAFALEVARLRSPGERVVFDDMLADDLVASFFRPSAVHRLTKEILGPVIRDGERGIDYITTLHTFFACNRRLDRAAEELHLHVNSLRYRLTKIEELTGRDLRDPDDIFLLEAAARLAVASASLAPEVADPSGESPS